MVPQYEEKRFKVQCGREVHEKKKETNPDYLRKKLGVCKRYQETYLSSEKYHVKGIVDDVFLLNDGTMAPFEYKYSEFKGHIPETYKMQLFFHALLIRETYDRSVTRGYVCFVRSKNLIKEVQIDDEVFTELESIVTTIFNIIQNGYYPKGTITKGRCIDCTYRKICV
jgi:CRISPR-associated exonuclease Cas4